MPSNPNPLEKVIEEKVCRYAKTLNILCYKFTSPARRSVPDRLFILPNAKGAFMVEFKRRGSTPTDAQEVEISKIRSQGLKVFIIDGVAIGTELMDVMIQELDIHPMTGYGSGFILTPHKRDSTVEKQLETEIKREWLQDY